MNHSEIITIYLLNIRIAFSKLDAPALTESQISQVINAEYEKMRSHFDKQIISILSEDEIEDFFETLDSKTNELIDSMNSPKKA